MRSTRTITVFLATLAMSLLCVGAALAAGDANHADAGVLWKDFLYRCFNFALTLGILAYFVTKPIRNGLAGRRDAIATSLAEAEQARHDAEAKFAEYDAKLTSAAAEIDEIYTAIKREAELEREKILASAAESALKIKAEAEKLAENEVVKARIALRQEAVRLAVEIAEDLLKKNVNEQDQKQLVDEYMQQVGELH
ncbi:MAG: F0F1 ATP synthase subunit B [Desulfuromonadaceae bacterium]|nr:F0F1 ATP synthase subunit B [Desulfuromonadaceae bacterium]